MCRVGINNLHEVPHLCIVLFHGMWGMPRNFGTKCLRMFPKPKLTNAVWGAGLSFSKCHAERKVNLFFAPFPMMKFLSPRFLMIPSLQESLMGKSGHGQHAIGPMDMTSTPLIVSISHTTTKDHRFTSLPPSLPLPSSSLLS
jgi:hypothetical protein